MPTWKHQEISTFLTSHYLLRCWTWRDCRPLWKITLLCLFLLPMFSFLSAEPLRFKYQEGERYRILSDIKQDVYVNNIFHHSAELLNRIQVEVLETDGKSGWQEVHYQHSAEVESGLDQAYRFDREYSARFWRDEFGYYDIDPEYFVPTVRDVPVFPRADLISGDTWSIMGQEVHDFREEFSISQTYSFDIPVQYEYIGKITRDGLELHHIKIRYDVFHQHELPDFHLPYPYLITGFSDQDLYFDNILGRSYYYEERYDFLLFLSDGRSIRFNGSANAIVLDSPEFDREELKRDIERQLDDLGVEESSVIDDEKGITLILENIHFLPDSAELLYSEQLKIEKISQILAQYPERDVLVSGHTALAGTAAGRQLLSEERAQNVANYLVKTGTRDRARIMYQGFGAKQPIADNSLEQGMRRNRRVEITILEN